MTDPQPMSEAVQDLLDRSPHLKRATELAAQTDAAPIPREETPQEARERAAQRVGHYRARWSAQVPPMYAEATMDGLDPDQTFTWPSESLNLVLAGNVGAGKTHAAYALGNHMVSRGVWVHATTVGDLLDNLRPDGNASQGEAAKRCQVLILDDLGAGKASEWAVDRMTALLDLRIREQRRTVVTTNATAAQLTESWGGRFVDRLSYRRTVHSFTGQSRRAGAW